jgi:osmotically-inducible protein OsmY
MSPALAFDPVTSLIGKGVSTALDVRTKAQVKNDTEIDAALTKRLVESKGDALKDVSTLVFAQRVVLVGYVRNDAASKLAVDLATRDKRIRSLSNAIVIGATPGGTAGNLVLEKKVDAVLTAASGVHSVNMRWKAFGGHVTLMGVAKSGREANLAVGKIKGLDGVKEVRSYLVVSGK